MKKNNLKDVLNFICEKLNNGIAAQEVDVEKTNKDELNPYLKYFQKMFSININPSYDKWDNKYGIYFDAEWRPVKVSFHDTRLKILALDLSGRNNQDPHNVYRNYTEAEFSLSDVQEFEGEDTGDGLRLVFRSETNFIKAFNIEELFEDSINHLVMNITGINDDSKVIYAIDHAINLAKQIRPKTFLEFEE